MKKIFNRRGIVKIDAEIYMDTVKNRPEVLEVLFSKFYPVQMREEYGFRIQNIFEIVGFSEDFGEVAEGEALPEYEVEIKDNRTEDGIYYTVKFIKKNNLLIY